MNSHPVSSLRIRPAHSVGVGMAIALSLQACGGISTSAPATGSTTVLGRVVQDDAVTESFSPAAGVTVGAFCVKSAGEATPSSGTTTTDQEGAFRLKMALPEAGKLCYVRASHVKTTTSAIINADTVSPGGNIAVGLVNRASTRQTEVLLQAAKQRQWDPSSHSIGEVRFAFEQDLASTLPPLSELSPAAAQAVTAGVLAGSGALRETLKRLGGQSPPDVRELLRRATSGADANLSMMSLDQSRAKLINLRRDKTVVQQVMRTGLTNCHMLAAMSAQVEALAVYLGALPAATRGLLLVELERNRAPLVAEVASQVFSDMEARNALTPAAAKAARKIGEALVSELGQMNQGSPASLGDIADTWTKYRRAVALELDQYFKHAVPHYDGGDFDALLDRAEANYERGIQALSPGSSPTVVATDMAELASKLYTEIQGEAAVATLVKTGVSAHDADLITDLLLALVIVPGSR